MAVMLSTRSFLVFVFVRVRLKRQPVCEACLPVVLKCADEALTRRSPSLLTVGTAWLHDSATTTLPALSTIKPAGHLKRAEKAGT